MPFRIADAAGIFATAASTDAVAGVLSEKRITGSRCAVMTDAALAGIRTTALISRAAAYCGCAIFNDWYGEYRQKVADDASPVASNANHCR